MTSRGEVRRVPVYRPASATHLASRYCSIAERVWDARCTKEGCSALLAFDQRPLEAIDPHDASPARMLLTTRSAWEQAGHGVGAGSIEMKAQTAVPVGPSGAVETTGGVSKAPGGVIDNELIARYVDDSGDGHEPVAPGSGQDRANQPDRGLGNAVADEGDEPMDLVLDLGGRLNRVPIEPASEAEAHRLIEDWASEVVEQRLTEIRDLQRSGIKAGEARGRKVSKLVTIEVIGVGIALLTLGAMLWIDRDSLPVGSKSGTSVASALEVESPLVDVMVTTDLGITKVEEPLVGGTPVRVGETVAFLCDIPPQGWHDTTFRVVTPRSSSDEAMVIEHVAGMGELPVELLVAGTQHFLKIRTPIPLDDEAIVGVREALGALMAARSSLQAGQLVEWSGQGARLVKGSVRSEGSDDLPPLSMQEAVQRTRDGIGSALKDVTWTFGGVSFPVVGSENP